MRAERVLRVYRWLLGALPGEFRHRWGPEMEEVIRHRLQCAADSRWARLGVLLRGTLDVAALAVTERVKGGGDDRGRGTMRMSGLVRDSGLAARSMMKSPAFTVATVLTLALGIGASTATYSVVHGVLFRDLPYQEPDRLVVVWPEVNANQAMTLLAEEELPSLEAVSGVSHWSLTLTGVGEAREITGTLVSPHHFRVLGVDPLLGRTFAAEEGLPGAGAVAILSYDFWVNAFGADPQVIGRSVDLAGADHDRRMIIGVMPRGVGSFDNPSSALWIPLEGDPALGIEEDPSWYVNTRIARLAPGATLAQANAQIRTHAVGVQRRLPEIIDDEEVATATVERLRVFQAAGLGTAVRAALGAVLLVLLIACANVANLMLARGEARVRDLSVRVALGASRGDVVRMLLTETVLLGLASGALGVGAAYLLVDLIVAQAPESFPGIQDVGMHWPVLGFALVSTAAATLLAGVVPSVRSSRAEATAALGRASRGTGGIRRGRLTTVLVGGQIALAVVVAVGSGLMLRSLSELLAEDPGLDGHGVVTFRANPPGGRYPDGDAFRSFYVRAAERVAALPQVEAVSAINLLPGTPSNWSFPTFPEGVELPQGTPVPSVNFRAVRPGYFEILRIPLLAGRTISPLDGEDGESVVVVNRAFVDEFWPGEDALGRRVRIFSAEGSPSRVVGVVGSVRQHGRASPPRPELYFSHDQVGWDQMGMWIMARVAVDEPLSMARALREAVWSVDRDVPVAGMDHMADVLGRSTRTTRFLTLLLSGFGFFALGLGAMGVFGLTAYAVGRRLQEFGVRIALGSTRGQVLRSAVLVSLVPVGVGLIVGLAAALALAGLLDSVMYGVTSTDPVTFVAVTAVLVVTAAWAAFVPGWRATAVDPVVVLGSE